MTHFSPHMHTEVPIDSITAVCLWKCRGGAAPSSLHVPGGISCAHRQLPCSAVFSCSEHSPFEASALLLPLTYNLKCKLMVLSVVAVPRCKKALRAGWHHQGFCLQGGGCHPLQLLQDTSRGRILPLWVIPTLFTTSFSIIPLYLLIIDVSMIFYFSH